MVQQQQAAFAYDELLSRCMGHADFARRLLSGYEQRLEEDLDQLEQCIAEEDGAGAAEIAHRIKGASANVSALRLESEAAALEQQASAEEWTELQQLLDQLRDAQTEFTALIAESALAE